MADKKISKYKNKKVVYNGIKFDSIKEKNRYVHYERLVKSGEVGIVETQVPFPFKINDKLIFTYKLDFRIIFADGRVVHEDVKGYRGGGAYALFRIKKKIIEATYGIQIIET